MWDFAQDSKPIANKEYDCQAWPWIGNVIAWSDLSKDEKEVIEKARSEGFKILKGTKYLRVSGKWEGEFTTYCARLDLQKICDDHEIQVEI